jgi:type I restriction-modification system DNA methylase subunit
MAHPKSNKPASKSSASLGFEAKLWLTAASEGEKTHRSVDLLGRVYEYFLTRFASAEGKNGGQFYTQSGVVRCLVEVLAPTRAASTIPRVAQVASSGSRRTSSNPTPNHV